VSRSHPGAAGELAKILFGESSKTITAAGAGYKVLQVVFNNATAYMHTTNIKKWDICAGNAILNALNGRMTDLKNNEITYFAPDKDTDVINDKGLLATMTNHDIYLKQLNEIDNHKKDKQSNT
jgi:Golgi-resident PAP phosphatase